MATRPDALEPPHDDARGVVEFEGRYYILATSSPADESDRVLKHGDSFAVFDRHGDIRPIGLGEEGIYHRGTRFLSGLGLRMAGERPLLLGSTARGDNSRLAIDLTNPDTIVGGDRLRSGTIHVSRTTVLWAAACHQRIQLRNFGERPVTLPISLRFSADYVDIFEVRGMRRERRGSSRPSTVRPGSVVLGYDGLDGARRQTRIAFSPPPEALDDERATFAVELPPDGEARIEVRIACELGRAARPVTYATALDRSARELRGRIARSACVRSSSEPFDAWLNRSLSDVAMMTSETAEGPFPYAGVPWFSTVFGRDALITALQMLWVQPWLARGVLGHLAATQATGDEPARDAQPGKILHEARNGEMAALFEVPFARYYGSHDATALFVILAAAYHRQTGDLGFIESIWPNVERALAWIDGPADPDGDGFVEYERRTPIGLAHQGWKDSDDAIFHADGRLAAGPIALCELQAYVYAARLGAAGLAEAMGLADRASSLGARAETLRARFEDAFWDEELGTYGIALDGDKRLCRVRSSNPGHCLFGGIVGRGRAERVADQLVSDAMFSGWGIRTVAAGEARYNPMSYHDGSIWPHDNAIAALGMARAGFPDHAARVMEGLFDASRHFDLARLPELFCGFSRRPAEGPTHYPVACAPQAWASGAVFMLLQACLGLETDGAARTLRFDHARLPAFLDHLEIENLPVGDATMDLRLEPQPQGVAVEVLRRRGAVEVIAVK
ncbi:MAG: glycogen debranching N-terminal domain-containing protein [Candidatus Limnocylindria bacterium]